MRTDNYTTTVPYTLWAGSQKMVQLELSVTVSLTPPEPPEPPPHNSYSLGYPGCPAQLRVESIDLVSIGRHSDISPSRKAIILGIVERDQLLDTYDDLLWERAANNV